MITSLEDEIGLEDKGLWLKMRLMWLTVGKMSATIKRILYQSVQIRENAEKC